MKPLPNTILLTLTVLLNCSNALAIPNTLNEQITQRLAEALNGEDLVIDPYTLAIWTASAAPLIRHYVDTDKEAETIMKYVLTNSIKLDLPPDLVLAVINIESHFDRYAISKVGARGLMQIMPFWKKELGRERDNLFSIDTNIRYGCTILKYYLNRNDNDWRAALAAYNGSSGSDVYPNKVFKVWHNKWKRLGG